MKRLVKIPSSGQTSYVELNTKDDIDLEIFFIY